MNMCIISGSVRNVNQTNIFIAPLDGKAQLTVYNNHVDMQAHGTMILPVPRGDVQFLDMTRYASIFDDLRAIFPVKKARSSDGFTRSLNCTDDDISAPVDVGSYKASIAPSPSSLDQLLTNPFKQTYSVSFNVISYLKDHYNDSFSFVICVLKRGDVEYHPFAYRHNRMTNGELFIPTRHYHESHNISEEHPDWDHTIYCYNCSADIPFRPNCATNAYSIEPIIDGMNNIMKLPSFQEIRQYRISRLFNKNCDFVAEC